MFNVEEFDIAKFDKILSRGLSNDPNSVASSVRCFKIALNDSSWSSPKARANGLRNLGLAQLGSLGTINDSAFATKIAEKTIKILVPRLFREIFIPNCLAVADKCEKEETSYAAEAVAYAAEAVAEAADAADSYLMLSAELALQVLKELNSPGCKLLEGAK